MATAFGITGSTVSSRIFRQPDAAGFGNHRFRQNASQAPAAKLRAEIEPLHFADSRLQSMQRHATCQLAPIRREQQPAVGRSVISGEAGEFLVETLKAQTEAERLCVLQKEFAGLFNLGR